MQLAGDDDDDDDDDDDEHLTAVYPLHSLRKDSKSHFKI